MGLNRTDPRYTGSLYSDFTAIGFYPIPLSHRKRGCILLNTRHHVVTYLGNGMVGGARIDERGRAAGGRPGDNNGREVCIHPYYDYPWDYCLCPPTNAMAEYIASRMEYYCRNDQFGYDQSARWSNYATDCSALEYRIVYDYEDSGGSTRSYTAPTVDSSAYTPTYIATDGYGGHATMFLFEYEMGIRGENRYNAIMSGQAKSDRKYIPGFNAVEYGHGGSDSVRVLQRICGVNSDGQWGYNTSGAVQSKLRTFGYNTDVDHSFGHASMRDFQDALNHGYFGPTWLYGSKGWWYSLGGGRYATKWYRINGKWYYFDANGWMKTGWIQDGNDWYYLSSDGDMVSSEWVRGTMGQYYLASDGKMVHDCTAIIDGKTYTFNSNGTIQG